MGAHSILFLNDPAAPHLHKLSQLPPGTPIAVGANAAAVAHLAPQATALIVGAVPRSVVEETFALAPNLQWVHSMWAGLETLLFPALIESPVTLTNGRGVFARSLAEFALTGMLWFAKDVKRLRRQQRAAHWEKFTVSELHGASLGIIGHGSIGRATSALAAAFGMTIHGIGRHHSREEFDHILETSDYLLVAAPLTPETRGLLGPAELAKMKPSAVLLNLGRGPVVDEPALLAALQSGALRGAVLDVYNEEPLPASHPFWALENVLLSPHCADNTASWLEDAMDLFLDNYARFSSGEPLRNIASKDLGY